MDLELAAGTSLSDKIFFNSKHSLSVVRVAFLSVTLFDLDFILTNCFAVGFRFT